MDTTVLSGAEARIQAAAMRVFAEKGATQLTVRELADAAGVARGTVYQHVAQPEALFAQVAGRLATEMHTRVSASFDARTPPPQRLATGVRLFIRRAHDEPHWGRFMCRFAIAEPSLHALWAGPAFSDLKQGLELKLYSVRPDQLPCAMSLIAGAVVASLYLVLEGHRTWRDAGSDTAELVLRSLGVSKKEARRLAALELPPLPNLEGP
jgi:AcrR family transcriptional regulator